MTLAPTVYSTGAIEHHLKVMSRPELSGPVMAGTYDKLFKHMPLVDQTLARTVHARLFDNSHEVHVDVDRSHRFLFLAETKRVHLAFGLVGDKDPRAGTWGTKREPTIAENLNDITVPSRMSDIATSTRKLVEALKLRRERDAAAVINTGHTYHAEIGGDGVSLFSQNHPHDSGMWANTSGRWDLSTKALLAAHEGIDLFVDYQGLRIDAKPGLLVVAPDLAEMAQELKAFTDHMVWDYLSPGTWFVRTNIDGLVWFERDPLKLDAEMDHERDMVFVMGRERRCFTYTDPRAVFGTAGGGNGR